MEGTKLIEQATKILALGGNNGNQAFKEACEFLRIYAGEKSNFYTSIKDLCPTLGGEYLYKYVVSSLNAFIRFIQDDLISDISIKRKAQIEVVSDFLSQANELLQDKRVHPAAPAVIIGATLEEFLRVWVEEIGKLPTNQNFSIDLFTQILKKEDLIKKQDLKDIIVWAGLRNDAAHGNWKEVEDKKRIKMMLEGVNLFMRKYQKS